MTEENGEPFEPDLPIEFEPVEPSQPNDTSEPALILDGAKFRKAATKLLWYGAAFIAASALACAWALSSTSASIYYYGGFVYGGFLWYRAYKLNQTANGLGHPKSNQQRAAFAIGAIIALLFAVIVLPEAQKINSPGVGTCWADLDAKHTEPVACFSTQAKYVTSGLVSNPDACPPSWVIYLNPDQSQRKYTCLSPK